MSYTWKVPEIVLHSENAGKFPTLGKCQKLSYTLKMPFLHLESAGNCPTKFPTLGKCRKLSYTWKVPEIVLHLEGAGNCPTLGIFLHVLENVESAGKFENAQI